MYWCLLQNCVGQERCGVSVVPEIFGGDPCPGTMKRAVVEAICGWEPQTQILPYHPISWFRHGFRLTVLLTRGESHSNGDARTVRSYRKFSCMLDHWSISVCTLFYIGIHWEGKIQDSAVQEWETKGLYVWSSGQYWFLAGEGRIGDSADTWVHMRNVFCILDWRINSCFIRDVMIHF